MERKMTTYALNATGNDFDRLCSLVGDKYRGFRKFYRLVEEYSEWFDHLKYEFTNDEELIMVLYLTETADEKEIGSEIKKKAKASDYSLKITSGKGKLKVIVSVK